MERIRQLGLWIMPTCRETEAMSSPESHPALSFWNPYLWHSFQNKIIAARVWLFKFPPCGFRIVDTEKLVAMTGVHKEPRTVLILVGSGVAEYLLCTMSTSSSFYHRWRRFFKARVYLKWSSGRQQLAWNQLHLGTCWEQDLIHFECWYFSCS